MVKKTGSESGERILGGFLFVAPRPALSLSVSSLSAAIGFQQLDFVSTRSCTVPALVVKLAFVLLFC